MAAVNDGGACWPQIGGSNLLAGAGVRVNFVEDDSAWHWGTLRFFDS
jgi:hypothetical protein